MNDTNGTATTADAASVRKSGRKASANKPSAAAVTQNPVSAIVAKPPSKSATVFKLLARARGATAAELGEPTGWQSHSVRAYLTGLRKKGTVIIRDKRKTGETVYRIGHVAPAEVAAAAPADPLAPRTEKTDTAAAVVA